MDLSNVDPGVILVVFMVVFIIPFSFFLYIKNQSDTKIVELAIKHRCDIIDMKNNNPIYGNCKGEVSCSQ